MQKLRLGLIGHDTDICNFVQYLLDEDRAELRLLANATPDHAPLLAEQPDCQILLDWRDIVEDGRYATAMDAIILGISPTQDEAEARLRQLLMLQVPLVVAHPACNSLLLAYELELQQRNGASALWPFLPWRTHPHISEMAQWLGVPADSPLGPITAVELHRELPPGAADDVLRQFSRDLDLIRALCGEVSAVQGLAGGHGGKPNLVNLPANKSQTSPPSLASNTNPGDAREMDLGNLSVQLDCVGGTGVRWTVSPGLGPRGVRLLLRGNLGTAEWTLPDWDPPGECLLRFNPPPVPRGLNVAQYGGQAPPAVSTLPPVTWSVGGAAYEQVLRLLSRHDAPVPRWNDASRAIELTETLERSLKRGRRIEVRVEEAAEEENFKGIMASVGCLFLLLIPFYLLFVAVVLRLLHTAGWQPPRWWPDNIWVWALLIPAVVFLLIQLGGKYIMRPADPSHTEPKR
ncbi:MAG: hypothetical protein SFX18_15075 [Pirellulales bacterium]|nr:hypothetical protein [Pirellulales bacterium]